MALIGEMQYLTIGGNTYSLPAGGGGTVTSVAVSNATNGGLSVSGSPISSSGTITIGHSNVLNSAQTTQAVYPITIDKNGHISGYGTAVTIPDISGKVNITETNDDITTRIERQDDGLIIESSGYNTTYGGGDAGILIGLNTISIMSNLDSGGYPALYVSTNGYISLEGANIYFNPYRNDYGYIITGVPTMARTLTLPDKTGTVALTSDIPSVNNATLTIQKNGTTVNTFTANASSNVTANITVPTKVSDLTNDSGFITSYTETDPTVPSWAKASSKPSYNFSEIGSIPTSISGYGITDAYTKSEVDGLVSGVLHYKGTKATVSALPSSGNTIGDVWHVTADGSEWAWDGTTWQELGTAVDLSGYVPTSRTINSKALTGNISLTASDVGALPSSTTIPSKTSDLTNDSGFISGYTETDPIFIASAAHGITSSNISTWNGKQDALVSGTNIKTINNQSLLGSGNITVSTTAAQIIRWTESA